MMQAWVSPVRVHAYDKSGAALATVKIAFQSCKAAYLRSRDGSAA